MSTVLLLDDDRVFRKLVQVALQKRGHRVLEASKGAEAEELIAREMPDAVVVDGLLPDTTGLQWIEKQRQEGRGFLVLFVSSFWKGLREFEMVTKKLGAADQLRKPVSADALADKLEAALEKVRETGPRSG